MKPNMDILIFGGQSNMQGQSERLSECETVEHAFEYRLLEDRLIPLRNPVGENIKYERCGGYPFEAGADLRVWLQEHVTGSSCFGNTNLVPEFCRAYIRETQTKVAAVHIAKGSTQIADWLPGTDGYAILKEKSLAAVQRVQREYKIGHVFFIWLQGESDAIAGNSRYDYKDKMRLLKDALKTDVGIQRFGVIRVGRFMNDDRDLEIMEAQDAVCREDNDFLMLTRLASELGGQPAYMNPHYGGHYNASGLELLGKAAGSVLGAAAGK